MDQTPTAIGNANTRLHTASDTDRHDTVVAAIRRALDRHGRLTTSSDELSETSDLGTAGLSSHATVNVMLAIEDALDIEIPDHLLTRATFATIGSIALAVEAA